MLYLDLFRALADHKVRYLLIGGLAMNLHGVPRMTMDVDLILAMDDENLDNFIACAQALNLSPVAPVPLSSFKDPAQRLDWVQNKHMIAFGLSSSTARIPLLVDILVAPAVDDAAAFTRAAIREVDGIPVTLAAIDDMIALKQHTQRAQDQSDIEHLERIRGR